MGQITEKEVGRTSYNPLQHVKYKYNIRGWLYEINDINLSQGQLFFFGLKYNTGNIRFYNGNIGETIWKSASDNSIRKYNFNYDGLSRLRRAYYTNISKNIRGTFDVWVSYDENGNITYLGRNGGFESATFAPQIDKLYYTYKNRSNQLKKVVDLTNDSQGFDNGTSGSNDDYTYDAYGNMITDKNKGITNIVYNFMNLPVHIQFGSKGSIDYVYDASGAKQSKKVNYGSYNVVTYYVDGYQYEAKPAAQGGRNYSELLFFPTAEGYAKAVYSKDLSKKTPLSYKYVYIYKDHLGNNRMSYALDPLTGKAKILEENHYYPFGLRHQAYTAQARSLVIDENVKIGKPGTNPIIITQVPKEEVRYKYKYNGKELQEEHSLNWYDYGARNYDAAVSRFWTIDPLAEKYNTQSSYVYADNNPVLFRDINGMGVENDYKLDKKTGKITLIKKTDDKFDRLYTTDENGNVDKSVEPLVINKANKNDETIISKLQSKYGKQVNIYYSSEPEVEPFKTTLDLAVTGSKKEAWRVFQFVADNSNVEWSIMKFKYHPNNFTGYQIATYHLSNNAVAGEFSPGFKFGGFAEWLGSCHSHPNEKDVWKSMDYDVRVGHTYQYQYGTNKPYHIYFTGQKNNFIRRIFPYPNKNNEYRTRKNEKLVKF